MTVGRSAWSLAAVCLGLALATSVEAATLTVTSAADNATTPPAGSLRAAMLASATGDTILFNCGAPCTITLAAALPPITHSLTVDGTAFGTVFIDGAGLFPAFFVDTGTVHISNLQIQNVRAQGGAGGASGGGGGLGAGAGLFVNQAGAIVTLRAVYFSNCSVIGGAGDPGTASHDSGSGGGGGGGGLYFAGGAYQGGSAGAGGGGALGAPPAQSDSAIGGDGGAGGGGGGGGANSGGSGGKGGSAFATNSAGLNGGVSNGFTGAVGGAGGFGGGGGGGGTTDQAGAAAGAGGAGGFGGGGGGGGVSISGGEGNVSGVGGSGGAGGGGGGGGAEGGASPGNGGPGGPLGSVHGGDGGVGFLNNGGGGGGGAAAGPAIFVNLGSVTIVNSGATGASATAGLGGVNASAGTADATPVFNLAGTLNGSSTSGPIADALPSTPPPLPVPSLGLYAMLAFGGATGLAGLGLVRRRR